MASMVRPVSKMDLQLGAAVDGDILDSSGSILLRKGTVVESSNLVAFLLGCSAVIEVEAPDAPEPSAFEILDGLSADLTNLSLRPSEAASFLVSLQSIALDLIDTVEQDPDSSIASIFLDSCDDYSVRHQIHSAILSVVMAKMLAVDKTDRISLVCAALTMNLAFLEYQDCLNTRPGGLSRDEKEMISKHPQIGEQLLITSGVTDTVWLSCVRHHHEKWDGSGYPDALAGDDIPLLAQILQIVDIFSARISVRSWGHQELANATMVDLLKGTAGNQCNPELIKTLIKALGAFPPGSYVLLTNDETAIVVRRGIKATCPLVYSLSYRGQQLGTPVPRETALAKYAIKALLPHATVDPSLQLHGLWSLCPPQARGELDRSADVSAGKNCTDPSVISMVK